MMETRVVDVARVRALVNNVHMMPLKARLSEKNIYSRAGSALRFEEGGIVVEKRGDERRGSRTRPLCSCRTGRREWRGRSPTWRSIRWSFWLHHRVSKGLASAAAAGGRGYNFAKTPLKAAQAPLATAYMSQGVLPAMAGLRSCDRGCETGSV